MDEDFYICRMEFENDTIIWGEKNKSNLHFETLLWNDEFQAYETVEDAKTRERMIMEDYEDFDIPY